MTFEILTANYTYRDKYLDSWSEHNPAKIFDVDTYSYSYDGKVYAYETGFGLDEFMNFIAGVVEVKGFDGVQGHDQTVESYLIQANVSTALNTGQRNLAAKIKLLSPKKDITQ